MITTIEAALRYVLINDASVAALIVARVQPAPAPAELDYPFVNYTVHDEREQTHQGGETALTRTHFTLDCWATTHDAANSLANAVRDALRCFAGTVDGYVIRYCRLLSRRALDEPIVTGDDELAYVQRLTCFVDHFRA